MGSSPVYILGISAFYHDSAACLIKDGEILAAAQEERFTRIKHDPSFPRHAVDYCLREAGIKIQDLSRIAFYEQPFLKFERLLLTYLSFVPQGLESFLKAMPGWLKQKIFFKSVIQEELSFSGEIIFPEHHQSHSASAFFPSPFQRAAIITFDGVGEWATTSWGVGQENRIGLKNEIHFPHSLGLLYSAFTYYLGFRVNSGEYKIMGLAPYGKPLYADLIKKELVHVKEDGSFRLNLDYFDFPVGVCMTNRQFNRLFQESPRLPESAITQKHMDIAASIQSVAQEVMVRIACHVYGMTKEPNLCLAGGVALNCVGNGEILKQSPFKNIWIQPASGDAGGVIGAALYAWHEHLHKSRGTIQTKNRQKGSLLGPDYDQKVKEIADRLGWVYQELESKEIPLSIAQLVSEQKVVALCQGRMEFGPRALGGRSIIADPRSQDMQSKLNLKIKFRESFRPFAPAVLAERAQEYFDLPVESPYMLLTAALREQWRNKDAKDDGVTGFDLLKIKRSALPAVTHVDYSACVQTVDRERNPLFYSILEAFDALTGCPVLLNTSFNVRGEPMVCTPEDAYRCLMRTEIDYALIGSCLFERARQPQQNSLKKENVSVEFD